MRLVFAAACGLVVASAAAAADKVSYFKEIRPLFQQHCQGCHQPAKAQGGYVMTDHAGLLKAADSGKPGVAPGKPTESFLLDEIRVKDGKAEMPKGGKALKPEQYQLVERWIAEGATDDTPASAKTKAIDEDHPPVYSSPPVVTSLAFSPDGSLLAVTGYHEVLLYSGDGEKLVARLVGLSERVQAVAFSPDGKLLATAGGDPGRFGEIQIWDVEKRKLKLSVPVTFDTVYGVSWSPDGSKVAFGCADNTVRAIDPQTGKQVLQMGTHSDWVLGTVFSRDGQHIASVSRDMSTKLTEVATERFIDNVTSITPGALKGGLMAIDIRPKVDKATTKVPDDEKDKFQEKAYDELLTAGSDSTPRLYKMHREKKREIGDDSNRIRQYEPLLGRVSAARFNADGSKFAAVGSLDGKGEVAVYDTAKEKKAARCEGVTGPVYAVTWKKDGTAIASGGFDGKVWLHNPTDGKVIKEFTVLPK